MAPAEVVKVEDHAAVGQTGTLACARIILKKETNETFRNKIRSEFYLVVQWLLLSRALEEERSV